MKTQETTDLIFRDEAYAIFGAAIEVHKELSEKDDAQILNCLKATGLRLGLLINFGSHGQLERKRLVK